MSFWFIKNRSYIVKVKYLGFIPLRRLLYCDSVKLPSAYVNLRLLDCDSVKFLSFHRLALGTKHVIWMFPDLKNYNIARHHRG